MSSTKVSSGAYCSVCHSAGKSEAEYTSHHIRASKVPDAKVTCPYLLALTCGYCKGQGHTPKYCPVSQQKQKNEKQQRKQERFFKAEARLLAVTTGAVPATAPSKVTSQVAAPSKAISKSNTFQTLAILMADEERIAERAAFEKQEQEKQMAEHQKAFPQMAASKAPVAATGGALTGWATIAASKPKAKPETKANPKPEAKANPAVKPAAAKQRDFTPEELFDESNAEVAEYNRQVLYRAFFTPEELFDESNAEVAEYNRQVLYRAFEEEEREREDQAQEEEQHMSWADM